jgi:carbon monoxide dehydrogenase subunit G
MDMTGEYRIPAPRQRVWEALNDPETLKQAITGCESLTKVAENELEATVRAKVGPVSARFQGKVTLGDLNPPESYTISGEGKGGAAGFAKGGATVRLTEEDGGSATLLRYEAKADVGGKLAQIGSRLVQGTAKKMADDFFGRFSEIVGGAAAPAVAMEPAAPMAPPAPQEPAHAPAPEEVPAASAVPPGAVVPPQPAVPPRPPVPPEAIVPPQPAAPPRPPAPPVERGGLSQNPIAWVGTIVVIIVVLFGILRACS